MTYVNATSMWNTTDYLTFISNINSATNGLLISSILIGVWLLSFFIMKRYDGVTAALSASATTAIVSLLMGWVGLQSVAYTGATIAFTVFLAVVIYFFLSD